MGAGGTRPTGTKLFGLARAHLVYGGTGEVHNCPTDSETVDPHVLAKCSAG